MLYGLHAIEATLRTPEDPAPAALLAGGLDITRRTEERALDALAFGAQIAGEDRGTPIGPASGRVFEKLRETHNEPVDQVRFNAARAPRAVPLADCVSRA